MARGMTQPPDFDPYELLGVDITADDATIDRAYKARIRWVHPDIAGTAGLNESKRLNVAREWLLDAELRATLPKPKSKSRRRRREPPPRWAPPEEPAAPPPPRPRGQTWEKTERRRPPGEYDPFEDDPLTFDYGPSADELHAFFDSVRSISDDERARVTYSLGDEPPIFFDEFREIVSDRLWARSRALEDAIARVWAEREDEQPPLLFPRGRVFGNGSVVANAFAQWILLGDAMRQRTRDAATVEALATRCTWAWRASLDHERFGDYQREVAAFLDDARDLSLTSAERLAISWQRHMGSYLYGRPGEDWFPGSLDHAKPLLVSARLAAVDASRIEPPQDLAYEHHNGFRYGLRLTAHVLALGGVQHRGQDFLRPWQEALDPNPSFSDRARWGMPLG